MTTKKSFSNFKKDLQSFPRTETLSESYLFDMFKDDQKKEKLQKSYKLPKMKNRRFGVEIELDTSNFKRSGHINKYFSRDILTSVFLSSYEVFRGLVSTYTIRDIEYRSDVYWDDPKKSNHFAIYLYYCFFKTNVFDKLKKENPKEFRQFKQFTESMYDLKDPYENGKDGAAIMAVNIMQKIEREGNLDKFAKKLKEFIHNNYNDDDFEENLSNATDTAERQLKPKLKLPWVFEPDYSGFVELKVGPIKVSQKRDLMKDLRLLKQYSRSPNASAHVHIEKKQKYTHFDYLCLVALFDEDAFSKDMSRIGIGRTQYIDRWAENLKKGVKKLFKPFDMLTVVDGSGVSVRNISGFFYDFFDELEYPGIRIITSSTNNKTIEFRNPSATILDNPEELFDNILYFITIMDAATRLDYFVTPVDNGKAFLVGDRKDNNIVYVEKKTPMSEQKSAYAQIKLFDNSTKILNALYKYGVRK